jgi:hypothetical protein
MQDKIIMPKRIALQLFGHLRTFEDCYESLWQKVIEVNQSSGYQVDVFIHTWNTLNESNTRCGYTHNDLTKIFDDERHAQIHQAYRPIKLVVDTQKSIEDKTVKHLLSEKEGESHYVNSSRLYNMYYSMWQCNELRKAHESEAQVSYDFVIQTRPDIRFLTELNLDALIEASLKRKFVCKDLKDLNYSETSFPLMIGFWAGFPDVASVEPSSVWGNDLLMISVPEVMNRVNGLAPVLNQELEKDFWNHEHFWVSWIERQGVRIQMIPYIMQRDFDIKLFKIPAPFKVRFRYELKCFIYGVLNGITLFQYPPLKRKLMKYLKASLQNTMR